MALDKAAFRLAFPEFASVPVYPDAMLDYWIVVSGLWVSEDKWGVYYAHGMSLVLAHHLVIARNNNSSVLGSSPGSGTNLVSSESAGDVSASYDTNNIVEEKGGQWNLTNYGLQYLRLARMIGGIGLQLP